MSFETFHSRSILSEKIGLIGTNGSGKTTLLKMLSARMEPDEGSISRKSGSAESERSIRFQTFRKTRPFWRKAYALSTDLIAAEREMERLEHEISRTHAEDALDRYSAASTRV